MAGDSSNTGPADRVILVTGGYDHTIKLWQSHSGVCLRTMQHPDSQVNTLDITPNRLMVAAGGYQHIRMYDLGGSNPDPVVHYDNISKNISRVGFQEDGNWMYTGGEDCAVRIWDLRSRQLQCQKLFMASAPVNAVCLHPNQAEIMVGDQSGAIYLWDLKTDHNEQLIPEAEASIQDIAIDPEGRFMAAVNNKGRCFVWSLTEGAGDQRTKLSPNHKLKAHSKYALRCKFSPNSRFLVTTSSDFTVRVWSTENFSLVRELKCDKQRWVWDTAFSADSKYIFTGSSDGDARLWNVNTGNIEKEYCGHQKAITALAFRDEIIE